MKALLYTKEDGFLDAEIEDINVTPISPPPPVYVKSIDEFFNVFNTKKEIAENIITFSFNPKLIEIFSKTREFLLLSKNEIHIYRGVLLRDIIGESYVSISSNYRQVLFNKSQKYISKTRLNKILEDE